MREQASDGGGGQRPHLALHRATACRAQQARAIAQAEQAPPIIARQYIGILVEVGDVVEVHADPPVLGRRDVAGRLLERAEQLSALGRCLDGVRARTRGRVVLVTGEAGVGKTALLQRFGEVIRELFTHMPYTLVLVTLFPDRWQRFRSEFDGSVTDRIGQHVIYLEAPRDDEIEEILDLRLEPLGVKAVELFSSDDLDQMVRMPSLRSCLNRAAAVFEHRVRGVPLPPLADAVAPGVALGDAVGRVQEQARRTLPAGVTYVFQGTAAAFQSTPWNLGS